MPAPAQKPPSAEQFPKALQKALKPLLDYLAATHIEDMKVEMRPADANSQPQVEFTRGESGVLVSIVLPTTSC